MTALIPDLVDVEHISHPIEGDETTTPYRVTFSDGTTGLYSLAELLAPEFPEVEEP